MSEIRNLNPKLVWELFDDITRVPRPSKKEEKIMAFLMDFAEKHGLEHKRDKIGNVVIRKAATAGYENRPTVVLQAHMDMVCEKNSDVEFDFEKDAIRTRIDGGWVRAEGTTLGADCGIGMAAALAVLVDPDIEHGAVEALFTVDEETGLTGAFELADDMITGKYLINLDSEDDGELSSAVRAVSILWRRCTVRRKPLRRTIRSTAPTFPICWADIRATTSTRVAPTPTKSWRVC